MLTCLSAMQGDFSLTGDPKNCNLELSITWLTQLWPVPGCCTGKCLPRQEQVYWICRLSEFILPKPVPVSTTVCRGRPWCSDSAEEATKTFSLFPYHKVCSNSPRWSSGLYGRTREKHANSQTTIWSTHIVSCEKCKLNPCLKTENLILPLALQPIVGCGLSNKAPQFFPIYHQPSPSSHSHLFILLLSIL
jgi:hypothetical protein